MKKCHFIILSKAYPSFESDLKNETKQSTECWPYKLTNGKTRLCPFNYNLLASGCVVTVVLIEVELDPILIVINDSGGRGEGAVWRMTQLDFGRLGQLNK